MIGFITKRLLSTIPTLFGVLVIVFVMIRVAPGDPALAILGDNASQEALDAFRDRMGLNDSMLVQFGRFLSDLAQGSLGTSMVSGKPVVTSVMEVLPYTLELALGAIFFGIIIGLPLGIISALWRNGWLDYFLRVVSLLGLSFPAFLTAILLILWLSIEWRIFPVISSPTGGPIDRIYNLILPALSLGVIMVAYIMRTARSAMLDVLGEDYIRTARAKGAPGRRLILHHALRNALIPIVTVVGLYFGLLIGNAVLTEIIFNRPGLGKLIVLSLNQRDYTTLQGLMVISAFLIVIVNLLTDICYALVDPRVKLK
ncbi:peptide/nickel transport system permease protein/glutathione transport system permease protein [Litoreibacter meonggei]|uniref:Peptide/nickel transport system permease protein/glutathione transport system permease protein n=1 Tax=Litoreibacter meonggei TaxID=1049199 RepID=A0A497WTJ4_9RHOB|nr:ABC transporter permease [Litoreibacter meonggei]RLJ60037.1 peptide/nickel transport system permease protein/glutathione transport system permease protein [Litoreibacter meonggei]